MALPIQILQGTDGIRGRVKTDAALPNICPLEYYLTRQILIPAFFERYAYAYATVLMDRSHIKPRDSIVVGWDPRDTEGSFTGAAMNGLLKAGLNVLRIGVVPTPAVPLYMLYAKAAGGMVLTASHNASDQNGIKLFHGFTGLKFLPGDDVLLSQTLFAQKELDLSGLSVSGTVSDQTASARRRFIDFCSHPANSWIEDTDFSDTVLVVDASNGAIASVAEEIFSSFDFHKLVFTNMKGSINESCGVADIEGRGIITASEVLEDDAPFRTYDTLVTLFELAERMPEIASGTLQLTALVFDGDGDRCYRLDYSAAARFLIVSSGDFLGIHQARYLIHTQDITATKPIFVNTVESDLNTAITARELGFSSCLTSVGDKWILLQAITDMIRNRTGGAEPEDSAIHTCLNEITTSEKPNGFELSYWWKRFLETNPQPIELPPGAFRIGVEESGHCVTPGFLSTETQTIAFFAGNGIKTGLNSLEAMRRIFRENPVEQWNKKLLEPFPTGISKTMYIYYVDKDLLAPGTVFRNRLVEYITSLLIKTLPDCYTSEPIPFSGENTLIYYTLLQGRKTVGAIFIRNSGTEDKSAVYLRGKEDLRPYLEKVGDKVHLYLLKHMKNLAGELARLESEILGAVCQKRAIDHLAKEYQHLPFQRVVKEMERKELLLYRREKRWWLTEKGAALIGAE